MSADFTKDIIAITNSCELMQPSVQNGDVSPKPLNALKSETMLPSPPGTSSPVTSLLNSTEPEIVKDFVSGNEKHISHQQQTSTDISPQTTSHRPNPNLNLRYRNMLNFPKYLHKKSMAFEKRIKRSGIITDSTYTLKLLQRFLQPFINREIDAIIKKYSKDFLSTAIENIRYNLGESAVSENVLQHLQYSIMKDATAQYLVSGYESPCLCSHRASPAVAVTIPQTIYPQNPALATLSNLTSATANNTTSSSADLRRSVLLRTSARHLHRRTASNNVNLTSPSPKAPNLSTASPLLSSHMGLVLLPPEGGGGQGSEVEHESSPFLLLDENSRRPTPSVKRRKRHAGVLDNLTPFNGSPMTDGTPSVVDGLGPLELELPDNSSHEQGSSVTSDVASNATAHSYHHLSVSDNPPPKLLPSDTFALGSCANTWLGLGAARGRIYSKHPWIFRYACDREDKGWLSRAGHLPNTGARTFLVLAKQIQEVATLEQRDDGIVIPNTRQPLSQFVLPPWLFQKVLDSTLNRRNPAVSRQHGAGSTSSTSKNRHFNRETSASSSRRPPSLQRSTPFVDQFAFTEEEMALESDLFGTEQPTHSGPWANRDRSLPLVKNGRSLNTQSDSVYKSGRQGEAGLKIGHI
nr:deoxynucleotidyltransferase terminal interacting [Hymenolepis microstoma]